MLVKVKSKCTNLKTTELYLLLISLAYIDLTNLKQYLNTLKTFFHEKEIGH